MNEVTISGTIKNVKTYTNERGTLLTGWLDQRDTSRFSDGTADQTKYVVGLNFIALDESVIKEITDGNAYTFTGRLVTKFDRRQGITDDKRRAPYVQLEVHSIA